MRSISYSSFHKLTIIICATLILPLITHGDGDPILPIAGNTIEAYASQHGKASFKNMMLKAALQAPGLTLPGDAEKQLQIAMSDRAVAYEAMVALSGLAEGGQKFAKAAAEAPQFIESVVQQSLQQLHSNTPAPQVPPAPPENNSSSSPPNPNPVVPVTPQPEPAANAQSNPADNPATMAPPSATPAPAVPPTSTPQPAQPSPATVVEPAPIMPLPTRPYDSPKNIDQLFQQSKDLYQTRGQVVLAQWQKIHLDPKKQDDGFAKIAQSILSNENTDKAWKQVSDDIIDQYSSWKIQLQCTVDPQSVIDQNKWDKESFTQLQNQFQQDIINASGNGAKTLPNNSGLPDPPPDTRSRDQAIVNVFGRPMIKGDVTLTIIDLRTNNTTSICTDQVVRLRKEKSPDVPQLDKIRCTIRTNLHDSWPMIEKQLSSDEMFRFVACFVRNTPSRGLRSLHRDQLKGLIGLAFREALASDLDFSTGKIVKIGETTEMPGPTDGDISLKEPQIDMSDVFDAAVDANARAMKILLAIAASAAAGPEAGEAVAATAEEAAAIPKILAEFTKAGLEKGADEFEDYLIDVVAEKIMEKQSIANWLKQHSLEAEKESAIRDLLVDVMGKTLADFAEKYIGEKLAERLSKLATGGAKLAIATAAVAKLNRELGPDHPQKNLSTGFPLTIFDRPAIFPGGLVELLKNVQGRNPNMTFDASEEPKNAQSAAP